MVIETCGIPRRRKLKIRHRTISIDLRLVPSSGTDARLRIVSTDEKPIAERTGIIGMHEQRSSNRTKRVVHTANRFKKNVAPKMCNTLSNDRISLPRTTRRFRPVGS